MSAVESLDQVAEVLRKLQRALEDSLVALTLANQTAAMLRAENAELRMMVQRLQREGARA